MLLECQAIHTVWSDDAGEIATIVDDADLVDTPLFFLTAVQHLEDPCCHKLGWQPECHGDVYVYLNACGYCTCIIHTITPVQYGQASIIMTDNLEWAYWLVLQHVRSVRSGCGW